MFAVVERVAELTGAVAGRVAEDAVAAVVAGRPADAADEEDVDVGAEGLALVVGFMEVGVSFLVVEL